MMNPAEIEKKFLSQEAIVQFINDHVEFTNVFLKDKKAKGLQPMLVIRCLDMVKETVGDTLLLLTELPDDPEKKHAFFRQIGGKLHENKLSMIAAVFISEAWMATMDASETFKGRVADRADKKEVVVVFGAGINGVQAGSIREMKRSKTKVISLGDDVCKPDDGKQMQSPLLMELFRGFVGSMRINVN